MEQIKILLKNIQKTLSLSFSLAVAQFKLRNEGSYLGIFWYLLEPLSFFIILLFLGGVISNNSIDKYPLYLFLGLIMYNFFLAVTNSATSVMSSNSGFIKSIKIKPEAFVLANAFQFVFSHIFEIIIFAVFMVFYGVNLAFLLFYPVIFFFFFLFILGVSFTLATLGVYLIDLNNIWQVIGRFLFFATPIFYLIPKNTWFFSLSVFNPLYHYTSISRDIIIYDTLPVFRGMFLVSIISIIIFFAGLYIFEKNKSKFAEKL
ncbi:MAG: ABC transporter permease [Patescibacteria group bacterium]